MVIQHNILSMNTNRMLGITENAQAKSTEKLSSGYKVNRSADDAAGLSISEKMRWQIRGLDKSVENATDGISLIQTAEGALNEVHSILQRMNELAVQAANDTNTSYDRDAIKLEIDALAYEIDRIASTTQFNTMNLLDGSFKEKQLQVGALEGQSIELNIYAIDSHGLGLSLLFENPDGSDNTQNLDMELKITPDIENIEKNSVTENAYGMQIYIVGSPDEKGSYKSEQSLFVDSNENAGRTMKIVQNAIQLVSDMRSSLGATQNRLEHTVANLSSTSENISAAESLIRDTDMAEEMVAYSKNSILAQAGQAILAQANQNTQGVLSLLQ